MDDVDEDGASLDNVVKDGASLDDDDEDGASLDDALILCYMLVEKEGTRIEVSLVV